MVTGYRFMIYTGLRDLQRARGFEGEGGGRGIGQLEYGLRYQGSTTIDNTLKDTQYQEYYHVRIDISLVLV